jgi:hypothetical protein
MKRLLLALHEAYPKIKLTPSDSFYWSPENNEVFYIEGADNEIARWSLLHEVGHALSKHHTYDADYMLLRLEVEAWDKAKEISPIFVQSIDEDHIQNCLDTYRDWVYKRSVCPNCSTKCFQGSDFKHYKCFNCHARWRVTPSRFCRTYRTTEMKLSNETLFV